MTQPGNFPSLAALCRETVFAPGSRRGRYIIRDPAQLAALETFLEDEEKYQIWVTEEERAVGQTVNIEFGNPRIGFAIVATDMEDLLQRPSRRITVPPRYIVLSEKYSSLDTEPPETIQKYIAISELIGLLGEAATYFDQTAAKLIFAAEEKLTLDVLYSADDFEYIDLVLLASFLEQYNSSTHREQRLEILAKAVRSICGRNSANCSLTYLLRNLTVLSEAAAKSYRLFVSEFSYEKILDRLQESKLQEIHAIHKTFSDIQNQVLAIPVATVIVATQMKLAETVNQTFWINTSVLAGCWIFVIVSWFIVFNQTQTLDVIRDDINRKQRDIETKFSDVKDLISNEFNALHRRLTRQYIAMASIAAILLLGLILSHAIYLKLTPPAKNWVVKQWNSSAMQIRDLVTPRDLPASPPIPPVDPLQQSLSLKKK